MAAWPVPPPPSPPAAVARGVCASGCPVSAYELVEPTIGEGAFGVVHKAVFRGTGRIVAVKRMKEEKTRSHDACGGLHHTGLRELKIMQCVRHPNVMGCLDAFVQGDCLHVVMELMDCDLHQVVTDAGEKLCENHVRCLARQIAEGLGALHARGFIHRDLTPRNVLLSFESGAAKLSDFGTSRVLGDDTRPMTGQCTALWYRAPELLYGAKLYDQGVDVWSLGCIIAEMFSRAPLFPGNSQIDTLAKMMEKRGTPPARGAWPNAIPSFWSEDRAKLVMSEVLPTASPSASDLVDDLLAWNPLQRPSAPKCLQHQFFDYACLPRDLPFVQQGKTPAGN